MTLTFITLDTTSVTLDSTTAFTWDADVGFGFVAVGNASSTSYVLGDARVEAISFDRELLRGPYDTSWFQSGSGGIGPRLIRVTGEIYSDPGGIYAAATLSESLRVTAQTCTLVRTPYGEFDVSALQSYSRQPVESGYRVDLVFVTTSGRN